MKTKISAILLIGTLISCANSTEPSQEVCELDAYYTFNFEQAQYYALPNIDFSFKLDYDWQVRMPTFAKQNFHYYEAARINDAGTNSILLKVTPFKREGAYISVKEQFNALAYRSLLLAKRDSWMTESRDSVDGWQVQYGRYEQEPWDFVIAHRLITRDTNENSILLELQMQCPADSFNLSNERCLESVVNSFKIYL